MKKIRFMLSKLIDSKAYYLLMAVLALVVYWPMAVTDPLVDIDLGLVIEPLKRVTSFATYSEYFLGPELLDVQPVRDASLLLDIYLSDLISHQVYGFFNLLIWVATMLVVEKILLRICPRRWARIICLLLLVHPLLAWVLSWPTARKHILAAFFLTCATLFAQQYVEDRRWGKWVLIAFVLSIFSQPIGLLWAGLFVIFLGIDVRKKEHWPLLVLMAAFGFLSLISNYVYYDQLYPLYTGTVKTNSFSSFSLGTKILSFSRHLTQIFFPVSFAADYSFHSLLNLFGLPVCLFLAWLASMKIGVKRLFFLMALILHPLILINFRSTNIFVNDTYLLLSLVGVAIALGMCLSPTRPLIVIFVGTCLIFAFKTRYEIEIAVVDGTYYSKSYEREPNCRNALSYANYLLNSAEILPFYEVSTDALSNKCFLTGMVPTFLMSQVYAVRLYLDKDLSPDKKLEAMIKAKSTSPTIQYLIALLRLNQGSDIGDIDSALAWIKRGPHLKLLRKLYIKDCASDGCEKLSL